MFKKNIFLYIFMLSLFACGRPEFGKASTDDSVSGVSDKQSEPIGTDRNNATIFNNGVTQSGGTSGSREPNRIPQAIPSVYPIFGAYDNFVYAPKSVAQILDALSLVASGPTEELLQDYQYAGLSTFAAANFASLWIDDATQIDQSLIDQLSVINVDVRQISLSSSDTRSHINNVAREITDGYLSELFPALETLDGDFLLTTGSFCTVAFKTAFNVDKTYENTFFGKTTSDRDFMVQSGTYKIIENEDLIALAIDMEYERVAVFMMPKGQLENLEELVSADFLQRLLDEMDFEEVEIHIPKMDFVNTFTMSDFSNLVDFENATFSSLGEDAELGAIIHQVRFILNEQGVQNESHQDVVDLAAKNELRFDRPFVFSIYDPNAQEVELLGRITN